MNNPARLCVDNISVFYPGQTKAALQEASLTLHAGEIGVLLGPSGCGKSTLLRAVAGLEMIASGSITADQHTLSTANWCLPAEQRRMGMVFQDYALFPHLNVQQNIAFGLRETDKAARTARIHEALEQVDMLAHLDRYPHELSGGQQQRVALARALAPKPQLLLLDEPFSSLDSALREHLAQQLRDILKKAAATALLVTHDQYEALAIGDSIGVLQDGRLQQWADGPTLYRRPATPFVANFIGESTWINGTLQANADGRPTIKTALGPINRSAPANNAAYNDGQAVRVLIRAHDILPAPDSAIRARIAHSLFRGDSFLYTLELADGETLLAHMDAEQRHAIGSTIGIACRPHDSVCFPLEAQQP